MQNALSDQLPLKESEKEALWDNCVFIFDANVLLNLYRYNHVLSTTLFDAIDTLSPNIWIPYQVAHEFIKNRCSVIFETNDKYSDFEKTIDAFLTSAMELTKLKNTDEEIHQLQEFLEDWIAKSKSENIRVSSVEEDPILDRIMKLFNGKTGARYSPEDETANLKIGESRYKAHTPPGYIDAQKRTSENCDNNAYGDYILWKQILDFAKEHQTNVVFVTNDRKEDWWYKTKGRTVGPRVELLQEFRSTTGKQFHMYAMDSFISQFSKKYNRKINELVISEFKQNNNEEEKHHESVDQELLFLANQIDKLEHRISRSRQYLNILFGKYGKNSKNLPSSISEQISRTMFNLELDSKKIDKLKQEYFEILNCSNSSNWIDSSTSLNNML